MGSKGKCNSTSHKLLQETVKTRLEDIQGMLTHLKYAYKENRTDDVDILEEKIQQTLRESISDLNEPSPASSLPGRSLDTIFENVARLLKQCREEDDATSPFKELPPAKPDPKLQILDLSNLTSFTEDLFVSQEPEGDSLPGFDQFLNSSYIQNTVVDNSYLTHQLQYHDFYEDLDEGHFIGVDDIKQSQEDIVRNVLPDICPPVSAFLGPKCAFWECSRPASKWCQDYCSSSHAVLAEKESAPGIMPLVRPGGIALKDSSLLTALNAKTQGKYVGIPTCEGAATLKSPWNTPELFDLSLLEGETIREWLFFGKPRRAFESGSRKQRSLPDYSGRGWHESRKQIMKDLGGQKRSYYMDPQPSSDYEWHLFEYEVNNSDACTLYRLELKFGSAKKCSKGEVSGDPLADLQKKMGRLRISLEMTGYSEVNTDDADDAELA